MLDYKISQERKCKVISNNKNHQQLFDGKDAETNSYCGQKIINIIYFIPVAFVIVVIYPTIYIMIYWTKTKVYMETITRLTLINHRKGEILNLRR